MLGDGLTTGFGAWVNLGSLSGLVKHLNEAAPTRVGLKTEWAFFERYVRTSFATLFAHARYTYLPHLHHAPTTAVSSTARRATGFRPKPEGPG